jgi:hypothetical protein
MNNREIIVELTPVGNVIRVTAMDVKSLTEIVISGPATTPEKILKQNAVRRLEYVLKKKGIIR